MKRLLPSRWRRRLLCPFGRHRPVKYVTGLDVVAVSAWGVEGRITEWHYVCLHCEKELPK